MLALPEVEIIDHEIPEVLEALYRPKRIKVFFGGRGGLKSWGMAQALTIRGYDDPERYLCTRELQGSIKESVHKLLSDTISREQMDDFYEVGVAKIIGSHPSKQTTEFIFEGIKNNTTSIKSMENIKIAWVEEAEAVTEYSWDVLEPTIRAEGSEIWVSFNPEDEMGATYQKFVAPYLEEIEANGFYEDEHVYVRKTSWRDAEALGLFPDELRHQMEKMKKENFKKYLHIWEGEPNTDYEDSIIQPEWVDAAIDAHIKLGFKPRGVRSLGFDPADEGADDKAYTFRHGPVVLDCKAWRTGDVEDATEIAWQAAYDLQATDFVYDAIGIGAGTKVKIRQLQGNVPLNTRAFWGSETPDWPERKYMEERANADYFRNIRAQYWKLLADRFENTYKAVEKGVYSDPNDLISLSSEMTELKMLKSELTRVQRKRGNNSNSMYQVESKQDMKRRGLVSPGRADSLVYSFANKEVRIKKSNPIDYSRIDRAIGGRR